MAIIPILEPSRITAPPRGFALFALGFRPFYLLAALLACAFVPAWILITLGKPALAPAMPALFWHGHEMLFGFAAAIIVGFLLTAGRTWTGLDTPTGWPLASLCLLWIAGRIAMLAEPGLVSALIDCAFLPIAGLLFGRVLLAAGNRRNYFTLLILATLSTCNILFHLAINGVLQFQVLQVLHAVIAVILMLCTVIAGRIVPSFTANAVKTKPRQSLPLDRAAIVLTAAALVLWVGGVTSPLAAALSVIAALVQGWRALGWRPGATWRTPLLWSLHLAHGWLIAGLLVLALSQAGGPGGVVVVHIFTLGVIAGLILAMITRTALGHTGRMLRAGRIETAAYVLLHTALLCRILPPLFAPELYRLGLMVSASAWALCFVLYLVRYTPILLRPRVDGRPG